VPSSIRVPFFALAALPWAACGDMPTRPDAPLDAAISARDGSLEPGTDAHTPDAGLDAALEDAGSGAMNDDTGPMPIRVTVEHVTNRHRYVPGAMFGGWGQHLGHLVRAGGTLYWVDDACDQRVAGDCDVNVNRRVEVLRRDLAGWTSIGTLPLMGVQQNTGAIASDTALRAYGVDIVSSRMTECTFDIATATGGCAATAIATGPNANYVGASVSPAGHRIAWWTNVVDGGGGSFSYVADYGGGWNGPRSGSIAGYNDFAYAHAGFFEGSPTVLFFGQVVSGLAPAWSFGTLVGEADLTTARAATFSNVLTPPSGETIASTNDLFVDPATSEAHLLARATSGAVVYYHRPVGGPWSAPTLLPPTSFRARFLESPAWLAIASGPPEGGLVVRRFERSVVARGGPLDFEAAIVEALRLPSGLGAVQGIYPEADVTQTEPVRELAFCVVGEAAQNDVTFFVLE